MRPLQTEQLVAELRFAILEVERPSAAIPAQVEDDAVGSFLRHLDLAGQQPWSVAPVDDVLLHHAAHVGQQDLPVDHQRRPAGDLQQHPLEVAMVQWQHVALAGLDQEQAPQFPALPICVATSLSQMAVSAA